VRATIQGLRQLRDPFEVREMRRTAVGMED
jgi:hypothetical protein